MKPSFPREEIRILGKLLLVEFGILGFGFQNTSRGIRNPTNNWNPEINSTDEKNPKTRTWNLGLIHGAGSLDSLSWGDSFQCGDKKEKYFQSQPVPAVQIIERGRKIQEEKKTRGTRGPPPVFPVYNLTRSPLTAALYYLNAWNKLFQTRFSSKSLAGLNLYWAVLLQRNTSIYSFRTYFWTQ